MMVFFIVVYLLVGLGFAGKYREDGETKFLCVVSLIIWPMAVGYMLARAA